MRRDADRLVELSPTWNGAPSSRSSARAALITGSTAWRYVADLTAAWELVQLTVDAGVAAGELALLVGQVRFRGKASGVESIEPAGWALRFRAGRCAYFRAFHDLERMLETGIAASDG